MPKHLRELSITFIAAVSLCAVSIGTGVASGVYSDLHCALSVAAMTVVIAVAGVRWYAKAVKL